jgi:HlyD family secretion protein
MSLSANIKLRKVSYLQLLLGDLTDKTKSLQAL